MEVFRVAVSLRFRGNPLTESVVGMAAVARGLIPGWMDEVPVDVTTAIDEVGDPTGEVWLHLLGLTTEAEAAAGDGRLLDRIRRLDPRELMGLVLGLHVPAWRERLLISTLEAAASGDTDAALRLLAAPDYYGGHARQALPALLELGPDRARDRIVAAVECWTDSVLVPCEERLLALHAGFSRDVPSGEEPLETVRRVTGGLRLEPEPYTREVVLVPQFTEAGWQVLAQHDTSRIVVFDAAGDARPRLEVLAEVFAALGEFSRLEIMRQLARAPGGVSDVARGVGLAKSTTHQHLSALRRAGLVALAGQAWRYRYEVQPERLLEVSEELVGLLREEADR